jgi:hypothetical protein
MHINQDTAICVGVNLFIMLENTIASLTLGFLVFALFVKLKPLFTKTTKNRWNETPNLFQRLLSGNFNEFAAYWNEHEIHNADKIQLKNTLLVGAHSRSTFDNFYVITALQPAFIASHFLFAIPGVASVFTWWGASPSKGLHGLSSDDEFLSLVVDGEKPLLTLPGGAYEAYRTYENRFTLDWKDEPGFARILATYAARKDIPKKTIESTQICPFFMKNGDSIYYNHPWWYTYSSSFARNGLQMIAKKHMEYTPSLLLFGGGGLGFMLFPRPIKLDTYVGDPIYLKQGESAKDLAKRVGNSLQTLINETNALPEKSFKARGGMLSYLYAILFGMFMLIQNILFIASIALWVAFFAMPMFMLNGFLLKKRTVATGGESLK